MIMKKHGIYALPKRLAVWWACLAARKAQTPSTSEENMQALLMAESWAKKPTEEVRLRCKELSEKTLYKTAAIKECCFVEFNGKQIAVCDLTENAKKLWKENNTGDITSISVYVKPEESKAYYVVNGSDEGSFDI